MCAHEIFEELSWNYADSGIGERGDGESVCRWRGISNEITGMQETHDLIAAVSGAGADLEHSCYDVRADQRLRSEEHTSELQSLMRISYAVFCLNKKTPHSEN